MSDIEQQLEFLYAYRDMLDEQIADPNTSSWDKLWLKWDRSDVNYEIADLENQLGKLSDELFQQVIESAWDELQDDLSTCIDLGTRDGALAVELSRQRLELDDRGARFREEIARKQKERAENRDYLEKLDGRRPPAPPGTLAAKRELEQILQKMRAVKNPTRADFEAIRDEVKRLRGPSYR
jgi:chromosome segregation ATPase